MKIAITIPTMQKNGGGVPPVLFAHHRELQKSGQNAQIFSFDDEKKSLWAKVPGIASWQYTPGFSQKIEHFCPEIIHAHGIWLYHDFASWRIARTLNIPFIVSPHGMLDPWALKNSHWKKALLWRLWEKRLLQDAACIHALCESEYESIRSCGLKNPVAVIPNGIDVTGEMPQHSYKGSKQLLFLGRLHPKKGLLPFLAAWHDAKKRGATRNWQLVIAGWEQQNHKAELQQLCTQLQLSFADEAEAHATTSEICFAGPKFGAEKAALLKTAHAFVLPSLSEGLPVSVLEAWSCGLPCLLTDQCNLPEGFSHHAAAKIDILEPEQAGRQLSDFLNSPADVLTAMGSAGYKLTESYFAWQRVGQLLQQLYAWVLGQAQRPDFVREQ